jgi:hypothetical protein
VLIDTNIAFAIRCDICGKIEVHNMSMFDLSKNRIIELKCSCGQSSAIMETKDYRNFWLQIPCFDCQDIHVFKYTLKQLLKGNVVVRCIETGMEISFIGSANDINQLIDKYQNEHQGLLSELGFYDYFVNFDIMMECINKIRELDDSGNIRCECGSDKIEVSLYEDRIELKCMECGSIQVIFAETEEDLKSLLDKESIFMHKHTFQCLDAINQNNDFKK